MNMKGQRALWVAHDWLLAIKYKIQSMKTEFEVVTTTVEIIINIRVIEKLTMRHVKEDS